MGKEKFLRALCVLLGVLFAVPYEARAEKVYQIGMFSGLGGTQDLQGAELIRSIAEVFTKHYGLPARARPYSRQEDFVRDIKQKTLDLAFTTRWDLILGPMREMKYQPFITLEIMEASASENCLIVRESSNFKGTLDLRGKRVATYESETEYFSFRDMLDGRQPEKEFFPLDVFTNSLSGLYLVSLGRLDAVYVTKGSLRHLKLTNPGAAKGLTTLKCGPLLKHPPMMVSDGVSAGDIRKVTKILLGAHSNPKFRALKAIAVGMKARFVAVDWLPYQKLANLREKAVRLRWDRDHSKWLLSALERKKNAMSTP